MQNSLVAEAASVASLADRLWEAEVGRQPMPPLTELHPGLAVDDAYQVQLVNVQRRLRSGARLVGHKIGLTAASMQQLFGIDEPDYGHLFDDMFFREGSSIDSTRFIQPKIEMEASFILRRPLVGPHLTVADVINAVEWVVPSFEIIDSRVVDWRIKHQDTVADNGSSGGVVLGGRPLRLDQVDLRRTAVTLSIDGTEVVAGDTAAVLGNPLAAVAWLGNALARYGVSMDAGHVVLPGACAPAVDLRPGMHVRADFAGLGDVAFDFV